jgi:hypothetical protein
MFYQASPQLSTSTWNHSKSDIGSLSSVVSKPFHSLGALPSPFLPSPVSDPHAISTDPSNYRLSNPSRPCSLLLRTPSSPIFEDESCFSYGEPPLFSTPSQPSSPATTSFTSSSSSISQDSSTLPEELSQSFEISDSASRDAAFRLAYLKNHEGFRQTIGSPVRISSSCSIKTRNDD